MKNTMKKAAAFIMLLAMTVLFCACGAGSEAPGGGSNVEAIENGNISVTIKGQQSETPAGEAAEAPTEEAVEPAAMDDALFIGDSRTVGLWEYSQLTADFFCTVGMSVYDIYYDTVSVKGMGKLTLAELLDTKSYGKIYLMLGINELGYELDKTVTKYGELVNFVGEKQPDADIIIMANLHVSKNKSDSHAYIHNWKIDELNSGISEFADGERVFYMDSNPLFDDGNGNMAGEKTSDGAHIYANLYKNWGEWIAEETARLLK